MPAIMSPSFILNPKTPFLIKEKKIPRYYGDRRETKRVILYDKVTVSLPEPVRVVALQFEINQNVRTLLRNMNSLEQWSMSELHSVVEYLIPSTTRSMSVLQFRPAHVSAIHHMVSFLLGHNIWNAIAACTVIQINARASARALICIPLHASIAFRNALFNKQTVIPMWVFSARYSWGVLTTTTTPACAGEFLSILFVSLPLLFALEKCVWRWPLGKAET